MTHKKHLSGFGLLEVLIAASVIAFGLLSLANMQARAVANSRNSDNHATAALLAADMASRIQSNNIAATTDPNPYNTLSGNNININLDLSNPTPPSSPSCYGNTCNGATQALEDLVEWRESVINALPGTPNGTELQANVCFDNPISPGITCNNTPAGTPGITVYTIKLQWIDLQGRTQLYTTQINSSANNASASATALTPGSTP